jgi:hypothetical protein
VRPATACRGPSRSIAKAASGIAASIGSCTGQPRSIWSPRASACSTAEQVRFDERHVSRLSPLGWDHINLTGDYVWTENARLDADGLRPLKLGQSQHSCHQPPQGSIERQHEVNRPVECGCARTCSSMSVLTRCSESMLSS